MALIEHSCPKPSCAFVAFNEDAHFPMYCPRDGTKLIRACSRKFPTEIDMSNDDEPTAEVSFNEEVTIS